MWRFLKMKIIWFFTQIRIGLRITNLRLDFRKWKLRTLSEDNRHAVSIASEKVASDLFTVFPLERYAFKLTKSKFRDNQGVHYNLQAKKHFYQLPLCDEFFNNQWRSLRGYTYMQREFIPTSGTIKIENVFAKKIAWRNESSRWKLHSKDTLYLKNSMKNMRHNIMLIHTRFLAPNCSFLIHTTRLYLNASAQQQF